MSEKKPRVEVKPEAAGAPKYYTSPQQMEADTKPKLDVKGEVLEAAEGKPSMGFMRRPVESLPEGLKPLEPLEPLESLDADYVDRIGDALSPDRIMPPLMPQAGLVREPVAEAPRLRGFSHASRQPLQFSCPYGLGGQCCGCRYMPCNELTLAVLGHVSRDYGSGGRCSAD